MPKPRSRPIRPLGESKYADTAYDVMRRLHLKTMTVDELWREVCDAAPDIAAQGNARETFILDIGNDPRLVLSGDNVERT